MGEQAERLMADVSWSRLSETLRVRRLLPTLGPRILELADGRASDGFAEAVEQAIEAGRHQSAFLQLVSQRAMAALANAGIRSTPLKGPRLGEAIYGDLGRRLSGDIDLLVAPQQLRAAVEAMRGLGYGAPADYVERDGLPLLHFALMHERGKLPAVELHWRVHWYERSFAQERLLPPTGTSTPDWRPLPADELVALLLFYARDGFVDLRLATDLSAWWDVMGDQLLPGALDELLDTYPALERAVTVALRAAEEVVGLPAAQIVGGESPPGLRERMALRLANPNPQASESQLYAEMGLIDGLLMPPGGLGGFVRRQLLPPRNVLDEDDRHTPRQRVASSLSTSVRTLVRLGVLGRYGLAMARLVRPPESLS
jgi:Uncharacterised nucleotidyltransferase